jgi:L-lysine 6-monooxygenase (NADPH-requiring)
MSSTAEHVHDLVGIGFGPSNLSLAIALREQETELDAVFLEKQPAFGWHRGSLGYHGSTNYSVVDLDLIDELYRRAYQERVRGAERLRILGASRLRNLTEHAGGVRAVIEFLPTGEETILEADAIVCATGYRSRDPLTLMGELTEHCTRLPDGHSRDRPRLPRRHPGPRAVRNLRPGRHRAHAWPQLHTAVQHGRPRRRDHSIPGRLRTAPRPFPERLSPLSTSRSGLPEVGL